MTKAKIVTTRHKGFVEYQALKSGIDTKNRKQIILDRTPRELNSGELSPMVKEKLGWISYKKQQKYSKQEPYLHLTLLLLCYTLYGCSDSLQTTALGLVEVLVCDRCLLGVAADLGFYGVRRKVINGAYYYTWCKSLTKSLHSGRQGTFKNFIKVETMVDGKTTVVLDKSQTLGLDDNGVLFDRGVIFFAMVFASLKHKNRPNPVFAEKILPIIRKINNTDIIITNGSPTNICEILDDRIIVPNFDALCDTCFLNEYSESS